VEVEKPEAARKDQADAQKEEEAGDFSRGGSGQESGHPAGAGVEGDKGIE